MNRKPFHFLLLAGSFFTGTVVLAIYLQSRSSAAIERPSMAASEWELKEVDGRTVKLSDFRGKVVILDFWATWCGPCQMEIPGFVDLQKKNKEQGLAVIGVSLDDGGPESVKPYLKRLKVNYPVVIGNTKVTGDYGGIEAIPTTFIINRRGEIVSKHLGYTEEKQFEAEIKPLLKE